MINEAKNVNFLLDFAEVKRRHNPAAPATHTHTHTVCLYVRRVSQAKCQSVSFSVCTSVSQSVQLSIKYSLIKAKYI